MYWLSHLFVLAVLLQSVQAREVRKQLYDRLPTSVTSLLDQAEQKWKATTAPASPVPAEPPLPVYASFEKALEDIKRPAEGLAYLYRTTMEPAEAKYQYNKYYNRTFMTDSDINAKPMVLVLGQYSTGKTTFIQELLGKPYPGAHIGPQPTTDGFVAVTQADGEDRIIPGNAASVDPRLPFAGLAQTGSGFLTRFQVSQTKSPLLDKMTFIDTPGVLSGEKQHGRHYDFSAVTKWFAERSARIILLFDAHKLDISDEFSTIIREALRNQEDKVRIVLNKADQVSEQDLMRIYGSLMFYFGKVLHAPEAPRVYLGSFSPNVNTTSKNYPLIVREHQDLLDDLQTLPRDAWSRSVSEFVARGRSVLTHSYLLAHLRKQVPILYREWNQRQLLGRLTREFRNAALNHHLSLNDLPKTNTYFHLLEDTNFRDLPSLDQPMLSKLEHMLQKDLSKLVEKFSLAGPAKNTPLQITSS